MPCNANFFDTNADAEASLQLCVVGAEASEDRGADFFDANGVAADSFRDAADG